MKDKKKILLLSPYDTLSHQYWWQGLKANFPDHEWTILTLEPRYYAWRIRGNSLSWAYEQRDVLVKEYDLLIACSLTDLSSLRGFIPHLASLPTIVYCHENQFFYPENPDIEQASHHRLEQQMIQLYNFACADKIIFNSLFNQESCLRGIENLLKKLPDHVPANLPHELEAKSEILPIPLNVLENNPPENKSSSFSLVWNHRWEFDKGLEQLSLLIDRIIEHKLPCNIHLLGQQFRSIPVSMKKCIEKIKAAGLSGNIGFVENKEDYYQLLQKSHLVLSTSLHEFQGLAVMEAVQYGCIPVLPNRMSYPEFFSVDFLYSSHTEKPAIEADAAFSMIEQRFLQWQKNELPKLETIIEKIPDWNNKKAVYHNVIDGFL